jgi:hypothetical protein
MVGLTTYHSSQALFLSPRVFYSRCSLLGSNMLSPKRLEQLLAVGSTVWGANSVPLRYAERTPIRDRKSQRRWFNLRLNVRFNLDDERILVYSRLL